MKKFSSPVPLFARRDARTILSALFTLALIVCGLTPLAAQVDAKPLIKAKQSRRARGVARAKARKPERREANSVSEGRARLEEPTAGEENEDEVGQREDWLRFQRSYPFDTPPPDARRQAWASRPQGRLKDNEGRGVLSVSASQWTPVGPSPTSPGLESHWGKTSGRANTIAVKPDDPNVVLIGASTGGIWRSTDGGNNFAPTTDNQVDLAVGSIAFSPSSPNVVYAGMGDLWGGYFGTGVLKSVDGGVTWQKVNNDGSLPSLGMINNVRVDPNDPNRVYATLYQYYDGNSAGIFGVGGFYVSTNGGATWQKPFSGLVRDLAIHPTNPQILYAGVRRVDSNIDGTNLPGLYKSSDGGLTWARVYTSTFGAYTTSTRIDMRVAVTPAAPQRVYIFSGNTVPTTSSLVLAVSDDEGQNWTTRSTTGIDPGQLFYNVYMFVDPSNASTIYVATRDVFKSTNDGASWQSLTKNFFLSNGNWLYSPGSSSAYPGGSTSHPDQHSFAFSPGNSSTFYIGNDGGVSKTTNGGTSFQSLNASLTLSQFVGIAAHPTDPNFTVGGTQDNGSLFRQTGSGWSEYAGGDGGHPLINPVDPRGVISTYIHGSISRWLFNSGSILSRGGTSETTFGESTSSPRIAFYPPLVSNGVDASAYFGTWKLFVSSNFLDTANVLSPAWIAPGGTFDQTKGGTDVLDAIGVAHTPYSSSQVIYTGSAQGRAMVTQNGGATWTDITSGLPDRAITGITVDPLNAGIAYVTVGGYGTGHVWKTTNFGQTWADLSGANAATKLPNIFTSAVLIDPTNPNLIYAATDIGVFRSTGDGNWETFNNGLPPVPVNSFAVGAGNKIQIGTYGRGAYELTAVNAATVQFFPTSLIVSEADGSAQITVTRSGDPSTTVSVDVRTVDDPAAVACNVSNGIAYARCDYETTAQTLTFAPNEFTKTVNVPLVNDAHVESPETVQLALSNPVGATLGAGSTMTLTITSDDIAGKPNPIDAPDFFVRMQYLDFLSREPDSAGMSAWVGTLNGCQPGDTRCDRVAVSTGFFRSPEFEFKGRFVFDFYKVAFNRLPLYSEIIPDISSITGTTTAEVIAKKAAFANAFVQRQEFITDFPSTMTNTQFVNTLMDRYAIPSIRTPNPATPDDASDANKVTLTRADLVNRLTAGTMTRAQVVRAIADSDEVSSREFNSAFVAMQYYGYLRRDPEPGGYADWLRTINANPADIRSMVSGFINSPEYRLRFGTP